MSYYAQDAHSAELKAQLLQTIGGADELHVFVLLDGSLDPEWGMQLWQHSRSESGQVQSLYQDTALASLQECSVFLCAWQPSQLDAVLQRTSGKPMLNLILSPLPLTAVRMHLARFTRGQDASGQKFPLRWADTAAQEAVVAAFTPAQQALLFQPIQNWSHVGRNGSLRRLWPLPDGAAPLVTDQTPTHTEEGALRLSDQALGQLLTEDEADRLLCQLGNNTPEAVAGRLPSTLYTMSRFVVEHMNRLALTDPRVRQQAFRRALRCEQPEQARQVIAAAAGANHKG